MTRTAMIPRPVEATLQVVLATGEVVPDPTDADLAQFGLVDITSAIPPSTTTAAPNLGPVTVNEEFGFEPEEQERLFAAVPARVKLAVLGHYLRMAQGADSPPLTVLRAQHDALDRQVRPWEYEQPKAS